MKSTSNLEVPGVVKKRRSKPKMDFQKLAKLFKEVESKNSMEGFLTTLFGMLDLEDLVQAMKV